VSFAAITHCVASQRVFVVVDYFGIDSFRKLSYTLSCIFVMYCLIEHSIRLHGMVLS
jgi:hypothetical protein